MKMLVRLLLCLFVTFTFAAMPCYADSSSKTTSGDEVKSEGTSSTAARPTESPTTKSTEPPAASSSAGTSSADNAEVPCPPDVKQFFERMGLKVPTDKVGAMGYVAAILGLSAAIMLVTGAILPACLKRYNLLKGMLAVGIPTGIISLSIPSIVNASGSAGISVGTVLVGVSLFFYMGAFFLPTMIAFRQDVPKKFLILVINVAGLAVPAAGLVALFLALKDIPAAKTAAAGE